MKVTLIDHTANAVNLLLFTKATRLTLSPGLLEEISAWPDERKMVELEYMANTIPSSWEFVDYTFLIEGVSRAYTHQQVRTRAGSYAQQSLRVVNAADFEYVFTDRNLESQAAVAILRDVCKEISIAYRTLTAIGQPAEDARGILPTNIATNIIAKFNLRTFVELARSRSGGRTQKEYQKVVNAMIDVVLVVHPWAQLFIAPKGRNYFDEIEEFAEREYGGDLLKKGELLKIVDRMRKAQ